MTTHRWRVGRQNPHNVYAKFHDEPRGADEPDGDASVGYFLLPGDAEIAVAAVNATPPDDLPPVLASVEDVARVAEAAGLTEERTHKWTDGLVEVLPSVASPGSCVWFSCHGGWTGRADHGTPSALLWHAIAAARHAAHPDSGEQQ